MSAPRPGAGADSPAEQITRICRRTFQRPGPDGVVPRALHRKTHALLRGQMTIHDGLPENIAHGLFSGPRTFEAWVRFSSSLFQRDRIPDARGMAVKLLGVPGEPCYAKTAGEQDLVMLNQPTVTFADEAEALEYFRLLDGCRRLTPFNVAPPRFVIPGFNPARMRWRFIGLLLAKLGQTLRGADLAGMSYFSGTPYRLGDGAMKFALRPAPGRKIRLSGDFRNRLRQRLGAGPLRFEFLVQRRTMPQREPLDDDTRRWKSPFTVVGELTIPPQDFATEARRILDRQISFTPWNCLKSHEPLGGVNRVRRTAYGDSAANRAALCPFSGHSPDS